MLPAGLLIATPQPQLLSPILVMLSGGHDKPAVPEHSREDLTSGTVGGRAPGTGRRFIGKLVLGSATASVPS